MNVTNLNTPNKKTLDHKNQDPQRTARLRIFWMKQIWFVHFMHTAQTPLVRVRRWWPSERRNIHFGNGTEQPPSCRTRTHTRARPLLPNSSTMPHTILMYQYSPNVSSRGWEEFKHENAAYDSAFVVVVVASRELLGANTSRGLRPLCSGLCCVDRVLFDRNCVHRRCAGSVRRY